jgi:hypothetical protein
MGTQKRHTLWQHTSLLGFEWNLSERQVLVPRGKRDKYITAITEWQTRSKHSLNDAEKLYGKLMHVCLVLSRGRSYLMELECLLADLKHAAPFATHKPPHRLEKDLTWWHNTLETPISAPIPGPVKLIDSHSISDASTSYGIGVFIHGYWRAYRLLPGWQSGGERDIGWAEAIGLYLFVKSIAHNQSLDKHDKHYTIWGDNRGVVEGWWNGRSCNHATNLVFRHIHQSLHTHQFDIHTRYIPSEQNPADAPSCRIFSPSHLLLP